MNKKLKLALGIAILVSTVIVFIRYLTTHPEVIDNLQTLSPLTVLALIAAYSLGFTGLLLVLRYSLRMYGKDISYKEGGLLNAYSSLVNFFGPGQSGAAIRGLYLKKRYGFSLKHYMFTTLLYYACYAVISIFFVCVGSRPWWQTAALLISVAAGCAIILRWYMQRADLAQQTGLTVKNILLIFGATALQVSALALVYYIELSTVNPAISVAQALTYTGIANFALFVALTPGAIGIREAFLIFSQDLHHISSSTIVGANVIDRTVYLVFLGLLLITVLVFHAKDKFRISKNNT